MNFVPSWKALYDQLAAQHPELKDFGGYAKLVNHHDNAPQIIIMLSNTPHSAALVICTGHKIKIIHVHHDIKTPVIPAEGTDEVWALMGSGATQPRSLST
jgi:aspartate/glutamate racemase